MNVANLYSTMGLPEVLEAVMLVCFGVAWPCASLRMLRTRRPQSNGLGFTLVILCGYLFGASSKMLVAMQGAELASVFWLYAANAVSVAVNLGLQLHYGRRHGGSRVDACASKFVATDGASTVRGSGPTVQSGPFRASGTERAASERSASGWQAQRPRRIVEGHDGIALALE